MHGRLEDTRAAPWVLVPLFILGCQTPGPTTAPDRVSSGSEEHAERAPAGADAPATVAPASAPPCAAIESQSPLAHWEGDQIRFDQPIEFETDHDTIRSRSFPTLDSLAARLCERSDVRVEIQVHTDGPYPIEPRAITEGDRARRRAESIRLAMTERGVPPSRVEAEGYPRTCKIEECAELSGRAQQACYAANRRVEVHVIPAERERPDIPSSMEVIDGPLGCRSPLSPTR